LQQNVQGLLQKKTFLNWTKLFEQHSLYILPFREQLTK
jgi:hypothetical protein